MALNLENTYPGQTNAGNASYPFGSAKNVSAPSSGDGTPWEQKIANDWIGYFQKLLSDADINPSDVADTVVASQYFLGMKVLANRNTIELVTNTNFTAQKNDNVETILVTTGATDRIITLDLAANGPGREYVIKKIDNGAGRVIVRSQNAGETIDGVDGTSGVAIVFQYDSLTIVEGNAVFHEISGKSVRISPAGIIQPFGGAIVPQGWLNCDGAVLEQSEFPDLFAAIGSNWDAFDHPNDGTPTVGGSQFALPNLKGLFLGGAGSNGDSNFSLGSYFEDLFESHRHAQVGLTQAGTSIGLLPNANFTGGNNQALGLTVAAGDAETRPKTAGVNYLIKAHNR